MAQVMTAQRLLADIDAQSAVTETILAVLNDESVVAEALNQWQRQGGGPRTAMRMYRNAVVRKLLGIDA